MLGLALGSRLLGPWSDSREQPLRVFALLEAGIGVYGAATLLLIPRLQTSYASWAQGSDLGTATAYGQRFAIALLALLVPTFLMGGTLPVLVRALARQAAPSLLLARLYGLNTLGAATGALLAGFLLMPRLGMRRSVLVAAAVNLAVAGAIALMRPALGHSSHAHSDDVRHRARSPARSRRTALLLLFALSGCAALALQVLWTRALTLVLGSSVYAFSVVLGIYLVVSPQGACCSRVADRTMSTLASASARAWRLRWPPASCSA